jgi:hypothetical protein
MCDNTEMKLSLAGYKPCPSQEVEFCLRGNSRFRVGLAIEVNDTACFNGQQGLCASISSAKRAETILFSGSRFLTIANL